MRELYILDNVYITMANVRAQESFQLINTNPNKGMSIATYFVPQCEFPQPAAGNFVQPLHAVYWKRNMMIKVNEEHLKIISCCSIPPFGP